MSLWDGWRQSGENGDSEVRDVADAVAPGPRMELLGLDVPVGGDSGEPDEDDRIRYPAPDPRRPTNPETSSDPADSPDASA